MQIENVKPGDILVVDEERFGCRCRADHVRVYRDERGLYVPCTTGNHYLETMANAVGELVGLLSPSEIKTQQTGAST